MTSAHDRSRTARRPPREVRAQVQRMTASDVFASSPQLATFLLFVVEAVLRGQRRAPEGLHHRRRGAAPRHQVRSADRSDRARRGDAAAPRDRALLCGAGRGRSGHDRASARRLCAAHLVACGDCAVPAPTSPNRVVLPPGNGMPTLRVAPFAVVGTPDTRAIAAETLGGEDRRGLRAVRRRQRHGAAPLSARHGRARAVARLPARWHGRISRQPSVDLRFKLIDESDATVIWSRVFEKLLGTGRRETERSVMLELGNTLVQPYRRDLRERPRQALRDARSALPRPARRRRRAALVRPGGDMCACATGWSSSSRSIRISRPASPCLRRSTRASTWSDLASGPTIRRRSTAR